MQSRSAGLSGNGQCGADLIVVEALLVGRSHLATEYVHHALMDDGLMGTPWSRAAVETAAGERRDHDRAKGQASGNGNSSW